YAIADLIASGAPIDLFGVGTDLVTSRDAPALGGVYKLVEQEEGGKVSYRAKFSSEKASYPGAKQIYRLRGEGQGLARDVLALAGEPALPGGTPLAAEVLRGGALVSPLPSIEEARRRCREDLQALPEGVKRLRDPEPYPVERSAALEKLFQEVRS